MNSPNSHAAHLQIARRLREWIQHSLGTKGWPKRSMDDDLREAAEALETPSETAPIISIPEEYRVAMRDAVLEEAAKVLSLALYPIDLCQTDLSRIVKIQQDAIRALKNAAPQMPPMATRGKDERPVQSLGNDEPLANSTSVVTPAAAAPFRKYGGYESCPYCGGTEFNVVAQVASNPQVGDRGPAAPTEPVAAAPNGGALLDKAIRTLRAHHAERDARRAYFANEPSRINTEEILREYEERIYQRQRP